MVLDGDTIRARQFKDLRGEEGKLKKANIFYKYWLEMVKNGVVCAAFDLSRSAKKQVFISKRLGKNEQDMIAAYFFIMANYM